MGPDTAGLSCPRCAVAKRAYSGVEGAVGLAGAGARGAGADTGPGAETELDGWECEVEVDGEDVDVVRLRRSCFIPRGVVQGGQSVQSSAKEKRRGYEGARHKGGARGSHYMLCEKAVGERTRRMKLSPGVVFSFLGRSEGYNDRLLISELKL
ncbi:hypothetical protein BD311DRAFT_119966 [Dichomitus squalens]|uniref:Uncharacterized protein n=1 Tax=Dichomitus squalens TaxID=114155 RepID=A0A4Q9MU55_9APHY|nr:hypothetical protein BD311DRAFT_119966 [Dichomitus squalens]